MVSCLALWQGWYRDQPLRITSVKLGTYEIPAAITLLLVGTLLALTGQFFRYKDYDRKISDLENLRAYFREELQTLAQFRYTITLDLHDPAEVQAVLDGSSDLVGQLTFPGEPTERRMIARTDVSQHDSILCDVTLLKVKQGAKVKFYTYPHGPMGSHDPKLETAEVTIPDLRTETFCLYKDQQCLHPKP